MRTDTLVWVESIELIKEPPTHEGLIKIKYKKDNKEFVFIGGIGTDGILSEGEDNYFQLFFEEAKL
jgi:hypothetical protein